MKNSQNLIKVFAFYKKKSSLFKRIFLIAGLVLIFATFGIFSFISKGNVVKWLYSIPVVIVIAVVLIGILNIKLNSQNKKFKDDFLKNLVKELDFDSIYTYNDVFNVSDFDDSSILKYDPTNYKYTFSDNLEGNIYDYKFRSSFVNIKKLDKSLNYTPFNGRVFILNYFSNNDFLVYEKNTEYNTSLNDIVYEDKVIKIYASKIEGVYKTIKEHQIRKISKYLETAKMKISIEFKKDKIYIMSWDNKNKYSLSEMNTINNIEFDYYNEFNMIKEILDVLDL